MISQKEEVRTGTESSGMVLHDIIERIYFYFIIFSQKRNGKQETHGRRGSSCYLSSFFFRARGALPARATLLGWPNYGVDGRLNYIVTHVTIFLYKKILTIIPTLFPFPIYSHFCCLGRLTPAPHHAVGSLARQLLPPPSPSSSPSSSS